MNELFSGIFIVNIEQGFDCQGQISYRFLRMYPINLMYYYAVNDVEHWEALK